MGSTTTEVSVNGAPNAYGEKEFGIDKEEKQFEEDQDREDEEDEEDKIGVEDPGSPRFTHPEGLTRLIARPSGNMAKIRCAAKGK